MADTYRPLRDDDPVGTKVMHVGGGCLGYLLHATPDWVWVKSTNLKQPPETYKREVCRVRVPDPWGELLEAAKEAATEFYELVLRGYLKTGNFNRDQCESMSGKHPMVVSLRAAISAVEAQQKGQ